MSTKAHAPTTAEELRGAILDRYESLSKRLQQIARYVLDEPNELALETLAVLAERIKVQPSAIVRFAQTFGFEGATQMQRLFRDGLLAGHAALGYSERVRNFNRDTTQRNGGDLLSEFIEGHSLALQNLAHTVTDEHVKKAVTILNGAETVYVAGFRRAFPIACYLAYSLQQAGKRTVFIDGVGGLSRQQLHAISSVDALIAISYHPYAEETVLAVDTAAMRGAKVVAISDSLVSPIAKSADITLQVRETEIRAFRSLSASMCLAQAIAIGFAFEATQKARGKDRRRSAQATFHN